MILDAFLTDHYGDHLETYHKDKGKAQLARIRRVFGSLLHVDLKDVTPRRVEKIRALRLRSGISPSTANRDCAAIKAALSKADEFSAGEDEEAQSIGLQGNPLRHFKSIPYEPDTGRTYIEPAEERALRWRLDQRGQADELRCAVLLTMNTGLRWGELAEMQWRDVDVRAGLLTVRPSVAKSKKSRRIPLNSEAKDILKAWRRRQSASEIPKALDRVFPDRGGGRQKSMLPRLRVVQRAAGIRKFVWHELRHHFASRMVLSGVAAEKLQELLGHSDIKITKRYYHLSPEHMRDEVERISGQWEGWE